MRGTASGRATMASVPRTSVAPTWLAVGSQRWAAEAVAGSRRFGQVRRVHGILGAMQKRAEAFDEGAR